MAYFVIRSEGEPDITITVRGGWAICPTPYRSELFVDDLHEQVPAHHRWWDGKAWHVNARYLDTLTELVREDYYTEPTVEEA